MLESGYIKLHRSLLSWEWYGDLNTRALFIHLLLTVNHERQKWRGLIVERGQRVASFAGLAQEAGLTLQNVKTAVSHLQSTGEITYCSTKKYSVFTVKNYEKYQGTTYSQPIEQPMGNPLLTTKEEGKEKKKKEKEPPISPLDPFDAYAGSNGELLKSLRDFEQMRARIKAPLTERAKQLVVTQLEKFSDGIRDKERYQRECLERSILNSWKGLFPLKDFEDSPETPISQERMPDHPVEFKPGQSWEDLVP